MGRFLRMLLLIVTSVADSVAVIDSPRSIVRRIASAQSWRTSGHLSLRAREADRACCRTLRTVITLTPTQAG